MFPCQWVTELSVTHVGGSTATQASDGIDEVLLHLGAEANAAHQLLQELPVLHLGGGQANICSSFSQVYRKQESKAEIITNVIWRSFFCCFFAWSPRHACRWRRRWLPPSPPRGCWSYTSSPWGRRGTGAASAHERRDGRQTENNVENRSQTGASLWDNERNGNNSLVC